MKTALHEFYEHAQINMPEEISHEIGHFNIFDVEKLVATYIEKPFMPYNRRDYYKISLIIGENTAEYADKIINIDKSALLFASPEIPYHWIPKNSQQSGYFCIFTSEFLNKSKSGVVLDQLPIFKPGGCPVFLLAESDLPEITALFQRMQKAVASDYRFKYDLLRTYVLELIHLGQSFQSDTSFYSNQTSSERICSLFVELLERQFPIDSMNTTLTLRSAADYAERLAVHVNHLNRVLKEKFNCTTTQLIQSRIVQEAKIMLRHSAWNVSEIAYSLGFEEIAHFSNFFKKATSLTPMAFRANPSIPIEEQGKSND